jgi:hypothetical protein
MKGCELAGRFRFADESKNTRYWEKKERAAQTALPDNAPHIDQA